MVIGCLFVRQTGFFLLTHTAGYPHTVSKNVISSCSCTGRKLLSADKQMECVLLTHHAHLSEMLFGIITAYFHYWTGSYDSRLAMCNHTGWVFIYPPSDFSIGQWKHNYKVSMQGLNDRLQQSKWCLIVFTSMLQWTAHWFLRKNESTILIIISLCKLIIEQKC